MGAATRGPLSPLVGWAILAVALLATVGGIGAPTLPVAGAFAWGLVPWLYPTLDRRQKRYVVLLFGLGAALGGVAEAAGLTVAWSKVLTQNTLLVAMLAAVTFLQLVAPASGASSGDKTQRPAPWRRLAQAATAVHLIGAVINLSMVVITAEQWLRRGFSSLPEAMARAVARGFLAAALWSPFFAAMAVALTYAPGASLLAIAQYGVPLAVLLLLWSVVELVQYTPEAELEARFGLSALRLARGNWRYALGGYLLVVMTLLMREALLSHQRESQVATASTAAEVQGSMTTASGQRATN